MGIGYQLTSKSDQLNTGKIMIITTIEFYVPQGTTRVNEKLTTK